MKISNDELDARLINELRTGRQLLDTMREGREKSAAQIAWESKQHKPKTHMRHVLEIPQREYFQLINKYGIDCFDDKGFLKDMQRLEPDLAVHKL